MVYANKKQKINSNTFASDFELKSTKPKPLCESSPGVIFLGNRIDLSSPNALKRRKYSNSIKSL